MAYDLDLHLYGTHAMAQLNGYLFQCRFNAGLHVFNIYRLIVYYEINDNGVISVMIILKRLVTSGSKLGTWPACVYSYQKVVINTGT